MPRLIESTMTKAVHRRVRRFHYHAPIRWILSNEFPLSVREVWLRVYRITDPVDNRMLLLSDDIQTAMWTR